MPCRSSPLHCTTSARTRPAQQPAKLGGTLGIALLGSVFFHIATRSDAHAQESAALAGARNAICVAAVLILATAVATTFMHLRQQRSSPPTGPTPGHDPAAQHSSHR
jgi:hypothetical protein